VVTVDYLNYEMVTPEAAGSSSTARRGEVPPPPRGMIPPGIREASSTAWPARSDRPRRDRAAARPGTAETARSPPRPARHRVRRASSASPPPHPPATTSPRRWRHRPTRRVTARRGRARADPPPTRRDPARAADQPTSSRPADGPETDAGPARRRDPRRTRRRRPRRPADAGGQGPHPALRPPDAHTLEGYLRTGGWKALRERLDKDPAATCARWSRTPACAAAAGRASRPAEVELRPAGHRQAVYLVVNADESEPGTFKDRELMERDPFQLLEGSSSPPTPEQPPGVHLLRGEYLWPGIRLEEAIAEAYAPATWAMTSRGQGFDRRDPALRAGAYICGEETALLEALEGRRGQPRLRPPFPAVAGLYACPTVINNVESIAAAGTSCEHGVDWYRSMGHRAVARDRSCSASPARSCGRATTSGRWAPRAGRSSRSPAAACCRAAS
jgi:hypothetical protein